MDRYVIYVLCNREDHVTKAREVYKECSWARILFIPTTWYLENIMYISILDRRRSEWENAEYVGCISWRAFEKLATIRLDSIIDEAKNACTPDVVAFGYKKENFIFGAIRHHPNFLDVWQPVMDELGYDPDYKKVVPFYYNYWVATPSWMSKYIEDFRNFIRVLENLPSVQRALWSDSRYLHSQTIEDCLKIYGVPYYPHHSFICERFPCVYFHVQHAKIVVVNGTAR